MNDTEPNPSRVRDLGRRRAGRDAPPDAAHLRAAWASSTPPARRAATAATATPTSRRLQRIADLAEQGMNLEGIRRVMELEYENARLREELRSARLAAAERRHSTPNAGSAATSCLSARASPCSGSARGRSTRVERDRGAVAARHPGNRCRRARPDRRRRRPACRRISRDRCHHTACHTVVHRQDQRPRRPGRRVLRSDTGPHQSSRRSNGAEHRAEREWRGRARSFVCNGADD